jgi:hypothetical protein
MSLAVVSVGYATCQMEDLMGSIARAVNPARCRPESRTTRIVASAVLSLALLALQAGCAILPSPVQQESKVIRMGVLGGLSSTFVAPLLDAFRQGLRDYGYVEGQNISIVERLWRGSSIGSPSRG